MFSQAARAVFVRISMLWVNSQVNAYGFVAFSTNSVGNKIQKFLDIFTASLSQAGGAMVGQNLGAEKYDRAKKVVYCTCISSFSIAGMISLMILICPELIFGVCTNDPAVIAIGVTYLMIMIVHFFSASVTSSFQCMVIGAGNASLNFIVGILDGVVCKIGFSLLLVNLTDLGVFSYFWGTSLSRILSGMICISYFLSERWKEEKLLK